MKTPSIRNGRFTFFFAAAWSMSVLASAAESPTWRQFVDARKNGAEPILPDFSYAGYHGGADAIPDVQGPIFDVTRYGARGDGKADDQEAVQKTIRAAEAAGGGVENLPEFPHGGDNTPWVARKRLETIQGVLNTPMRRELYDRDNPREALLGQWPTADGRPWVAPAGK